MRHYYNEFDAHAAAWLKNLIEAGHLPPGDVDERSITEVQPDDLAGYVQCHFFAGIGGWPYALRLAGWPEDRPVWTGSCPCQPFSVAGKRRGSADARHLWPDWCRLLAECRPAVVFGEQVASKAGRAWLAAVRADLEGLGYAVGAADLCAAGAGAPHIRQRLYFSGRGDTNGTRLEGFAGDGHNRNESRRLSAVTPRALVTTSTTCPGLAHAPRRGLGKHGGAPGDSGHADERDPARGLADAPDP